MDIFKGQAKKNESGTNTQRVCMEAAQAQSVVSDESDQTIGVPSEEMIMNNDDLRTTKELEVYYPSNNATTKKKSNGNHQQRRKYSCKQHKSVYMIETFERFRCLG